MKTIRQEQRGISLLEVLAAIFVVSIGLLGVLAVIPFGAHQVSKAQHAEYASHMLANAIEEIRIREMVPESLQGGMPDYTKFAWGEPYPIPDPNGLTHIWRVLMEEGWKEHMRGQDDLVYSTYDDKRPDFVNQGGKIQSSGKYTWFFTYLPKVNEDEVNVDILACYNRVPEDDRQVLITNGNGDGNGEGNGHDRYSISRGGSRFTLPDASHLELLTQTKYVFVTWESDVLPVIGGAWCRIVFLDKSNPSHPQIIVTGNGLRRLRDILNRDVEGVQDTLQIWMYIPSGVLYHRQVPDVPIR